jgi:hypothetical protein
MSRLAGLLILVLGATAFADEAEPPAAPPKTEEATPAAKPNKFPLRVVKILPESEQALLFDKNRGRHVLVEVGEAIGDYTVTGILEDEVTLSGKDMPVEVVLAAPESKWKAKRAAKKAAAEKAAAADDAAPEDPYDAAPAPATKKPADPYADDAIEIVDETPIRATPWNGNASAKEGEKSTTSPFATMDESAAKPSADVANAGKPTAPDVKATADGPTKLSKKEVNLALNDFGALSKSIDGSFVAQGLSLEKVAPGSVFAKAGLVAGDVVTAVDGKPLRTIDDAADLYARAGSMKSANVQIVRAGKPQTLRVVIQ